MTTEQLPEAERLRREMMGKRLDASTATARPHAGPHVPRTKADAPEREVAVVQALTEGVDPDERVEFMGAYFRVAEKVGLMPIMKFAAAADSDIDESDMAALSAIYAMLKDCIYPGTPPCGECEDCLEQRRLIRDAQGGNAKLADVDLGELGIAVTACPHYDAGDWGRFERHATKMKAGVDDLLPVARNVMEIVTSRPTQPRTASSSS
jgi:hypothetical protein